LRHVASFFHHSLDKASGVGLTCPVTREEAKKLVYENPDAAVDLIVHSNKALDILNSRFA